MSDNETVQGEVIESFDMTDSDIESFLTGGEEPSFHPVLEVWREVLKPARDEKDVKVTPAWANRMVTAYQGLDYSHMVSYRDNYFAKILELLDILDLEIASDLDCLKALTPEEDAERNAVHYKNLLLNWQLAVLQWELDWDTSAPDAAAELAAISEVHKMFFGQTGLTNFLDNIKFEFSESDQRELAEALQELKEGQ